LGTLGLCVLELFATYATDGRTDRQTDGQKQRLLPLPYGRGGIIKKLSLKLTTDGYKASRGLSATTKLLVFSMLQVDILDTAGNLEFPAMRRLSISTAHAFLLVFDVDSRQSFEEVCQLWEQIGEQRPNRDEIPCVIAANKVRTSHVL